MKVGGKYKGKSFGYCIIDKIVDNVVHYTLYDDSGKIQELHTISMASFHCGYHEHEMISNEDKSYEPQKDDHYNNENGSLYLFAQHHNLNAWEFDILKRVVRCRKKGQFKEDLEKTKRVIDLYLKEFEA